MEPRPTWGFKPGRPNRNVQKSAWNFMQLE